MGTNIPVWEGSLNTRSASASWVQLRSTTVGTVTVLADSNGQFLVTGIPSGTYALWTGPTQVGPWTQQDNSYVIQLPAKTTVASDFFASNPPSLKGAFGWHNVKTDYGALGDGTDDPNGAITSGTAILTSTSTPGPWKSTDVGKLIIVPGAGAAGVLLSTTILSYQSATQVTLAANAGTTVSGKLVSWGTNDTTAIQNALNGAGTFPGGTVYFPPGQYLVNAGLTFKSSTSIRGTGDHGACVIRGTGLATAILAQSTPGTRIYNVSISDLVLDNGDRAVVGGIGLDLNDVTTGQFQRIVIQNVETGARVTDQGGATGAYFNTFIDVNATTVKDGFVIQSNETRFIVCKVNDFIRYGWNLDTGGNSLNLQACSIETGAATNSICIRAASNGLRVYGLRMDNVGGAGSIGIQITSGATQTVISGLYVGVGPVTLVSDAAADTIWLSTAQSTTGALGIGTGVPAGLIEARKAANSYFSGATWTGGGGQTPQDAIVITNSFAGGLDPVLLFRQATSLSVLKTSAALDVTGASSWADGNLASQISDLLFILRYTDDTLYERFRVTYAGHLRTSGVGPVTTSALGTNVASAVGSGDDTKGTITITAGGTLITAPQKICTVTFAKAYAAAPRVIVVNSTTGAADATHSLTVYGTAAVGTAGFDLWAISGNINAAAVVKVDFHTLE